MFGVKKCWVKKMFGRKQFLDENNFWTKQICGRTQICRRTKIVGEKKIGRKQTLVQKKFSVQFMCSEAMLSLRIVSWMARKTPDRRTDAQCKP
jgi:hypothetical protein